MITFNNKNYEEISIKVSFGEYSATQDGIKRSGYAPFITFTFNNIILGLETIYDKKWLEELMPDDKKDISNYISDIAYEDEKGWISLITGDYKCFINKIENNMFMLEFSCETEEFGEYYKISLNEKVEINFE